MAEVSYQSMLGTAAGTGGAAAAFGPLPADAVSTRRRDAVRSVTVAVSRDQARWLRRVQDVTGDGIDADAVVRALIDVGMHLDVDWALLSGARPMREAVRDAVMVRRPAAGD